MKDFKSQELEIINKMDKKLSVILDILNQECNGDGIIINHAKYLQFIALLNDIVRLWDNISIKNDTTEKIYISLVTINEGFFKINKKYYDEEPFI